jgi:hypothetical protein
LKGPSPRVLRRTGLALAATLICLAAAFLLLPLAVQGLLRVLDLVLTGFIWLTTSLGSNPDAWTILVAVGSALAGVLITTRALALIGALVLVSGLALYGLQRLLDTKEESAP